ncbi:MAG: hypothetical protein M1834_005013 [Cirrosporium novae-zelandiae]|nr:MAG: hypothetical protein M1834_005013 [Cirrosporium novae-zelandiae]
MTSRTRTGCWTCRARRVKCDGENSSPKAQSKTNERVKFPEKHPVCARCSRNNLICGYGLRLIWHEDALARGMCHGREGVWSKQRNITPGRPGRNIGLDLQLKRKAEYAARLSQMLPRDRGNKFEQYLHHTGPARFLNTTIKDLQLYFRYDDETEERNSRTASEERQISTPNVELNEVTHMNLQCHLSAIPGKFVSSSHDSALLSYYEGIICSTATLLDDELHNPYRYVILPMALQSEGLYHATLAIAANTLRLAYPKYAVVALEHRQRALKSLIRATRKAEWNAEEMDEMLGLVLMLCWFEISDGSRPTWVAHLNGFQSLIQYIQQHSYYTSLQNQKLDRFFRLYFAFHLVMAKTAFRMDDVTPPSSNATTPTGVLTTSLLSSTHSENSSPCSELGSPLESGGSADTCVGYPSCSKSTDFLSLNMEFDSLNEIDPYMGFSNALLLLINEIADLAQSSSYTSSPRNLIAVGEESAIQAKVKRLKTSLENLKQSPPFYGTTKTKEGTPKGYQKHELVLKATAEAYRLGALVFLYETCSLLTARAASLTNPEPPLLGPEEKEQYISKILHLIDESNYDDMSIMTTAACPLWALFLAGCCSRKEHNRVVVLSIFEAWEGQKRFGNVTPAREVVEMVWRQRDLAGDDNPKPVRREKGNKRRKSSNQESPLREWEESSPNVLERYEWERAMEMMGGWKISLT